MNSILQTKRLSLRQFTLNDTQFIIKLLNSPGWIQFIGDRNVKTEAQAISYLKNGPMKSYAENGFGLWMVEKLEDQQPIGMCGLIKRDILNIPDIGFAFLPDYNGQGYAFEISGAVMNYARTSLNLHTIAAITLPNNTRSIKLIEKIGLKFIKTINLPPTGEELLLFNNQ